MSKAWQPSWGSAAFGALANEREVIGSVVLGVCIEEVLLVLSKHKDSTPPCLVSTCQAEKDDSDGIFKVFLPSCVGFCMQCLISVSLPARKL
jgi:hypothetical protein